MKIMLHRFALGIIAAALLAGCGGSQTLIGAPGGVPQSHVIATHANRGGSWMPPEAKREDLLYDSNGCGGTCVYSYPRGKLVGSLDVGGYDLCSSSSGDVFIASGYNIYEFAHGGTIPIKTLIDSSGNANGCSVDPTTGNLAVTDSRAFGNGISDVRIYENDANEPRIYPDPDTGTMWLCSFDDKGDLFVDGLTNHFQSFTLAELPKHARHLFVVTLNRQINNVAGVQWDNGRLAVGDPTGPKGYSIIYEFAIDGKEGTEVRSTPLRNASKLGPFWVQGSRVVGADQTLGANIQFWKYPRGGHPIKTIKGASQGGVTVSVAPSGS